MPNRILRDGILTSEKVESLSLEAENFYRRLMSVVDDFGRIEANPKILLAKCYPLRLDRVSAEDVGRMTAECCHATDNRPLVTAYSVDGKNYLQINNFGQRERASKCPPPTFSGHLTAFDRESPQLAAHARASNSNTNTTSPVVYSYLEIPSVVQNEKSDPWVGTGFSDGQDFQDWYKRLYAAHPQKGDYQIGQDYLREHFVIKRTFTRQRFEEIYAEHRRSRAWTRNGGQAIPKISTFCKDEGCAYGPTEIPIENNNSRSIMEGV